MSALTGEKRFKDTGEWLMAAHSKNKPAQTMFAIV